MALENSIIWGIMWKRLILIRDCIYKIVAYSACECMGHVFFRNVFSTMFDFIEYNIISAGV